MQNKQYEPTVSKTTSGNESEGVQHSEEAFGGQTEREAPLEARAFGSEQPNPEPSKVKADLLGHSKPHISKAMEEQPAGATADGTLPGKEVSDRKLSANRENAKRSTGPKTPEGKANSSRNSYKHGIFSINLVRQGETEKNDKAVFEEILNRIAGDYVPVGFMEALLVEKITTEMVRFRRLLCHEQLEFGYKNPFWSDGVDRILRYQSTINRQLFQAIEQLERLQAKRKEQASSSGDNQSALSESGDELTNADPGENDTGVDCSDQEEGKR